MLEVNNFNAVRISLASPDQIQSWSRGEVTKPSHVGVIVQVQPASAQEWRRKQTHVPVEMDRRAARAGNAHQLGHLHRFVGLARGSRHRFVVYETEVILYSTKLCNSGRYA